MSILIVDDSKEIRELLRILLSKNMDVPLLFAESAVKAFEMLNSESASIDLILMDVEMPEINGVEACKKIKTYEKYKNIPVIMVTGETDKTVLKKAFSFGAVDYITKPLHKVELLARIASTLKLKQEMDKRMAREQELVKLTEELKEVNEQLKFLSSHDGLTGVTNRRYFEIYLEKEWKAAKRDKTTISLLMIDVDYFKLYNDTYGHQGGDTCLKQVANAIKTAVSRPRDLVARYGGEEFTVVMPNTDIKGAENIARCIMETFKKLAIPHYASKVSGQVTLSMGAASIVPEGDAPYEELISAADKGLYMAKEQGRNRFIANYEENK